MTPSTNNEQQKYMLTPQHTTHVGWNFSNQYTCNGGKIKKFQSI